MRSSTLPAGLIPVERFQVAFDRAQRCPYCHGELERDRAALAACLDCRTLLHATCAEHHGGCTTRGCARARREDPRRRAAEEPRRAPLAIGPAWPALLLVLLAGGASWALGHGLGRQLLPPTPPVVWTRPPVPPVPVTVPRPTPPPLVAVGALPAPALVQVQAPAHTRADTLFLRAVVSHALEQARIEVRGPGGELLVFDAVRPGEVQAAVTLPARGQHLIEVRVTLPDGRTAVARHAVVRS